MGILRRNPAADEVAESGRMKAEELVTPMPERKDGKPDDAAGKDDLAERHMRRKDEKPRHEGGAQYVETKSVHVRPVRPAAVRPYPGRK